MRPQKNEKKIQIQKLNNYLLQCLKNKYLEQTQVQLAQEYGLKQSEVSRIFNEKGYHRSNAKSDKGYFEQVFKFQRSKELKDLENEMKRFVRKPHNNSNPVFYVIKCQLHQADHLKYFIERAFPNEILAIHTNEDSLVIYINPEFKPGKNEKLFKDFIEALKLK